MRSEKKRYVKNTIFILVSTVLITLTNFFLKPLIARFMAPAEYGVLALILSTSTIIPAFTLLSINSGVLYFISKNQKNNRFVGEIITTSLIIFMTLSILFFLPLLIAIRKLVPSITFYSFLIMYILAFATALFYILQAIQQGLEKFKLFSITNFLSAFLAGMLSVLASYIFRTATSVALFRTLSIFIVVFFLGIKLEFGSLNKKYVKKILRYCLPLGMAGLFSVFSVVIDKYFIAYFFSTSEVGFYDIGYSLVTAILPFTVAFSTTMAPRIVKKISSFSSYFNKIALILTIFTTLFGLATFYFSDIITTILLGKEYYSATPIIKIISLSLPFIIFIALNSTSLNSLGKTKFSAIISITFIVSLFISNLFLTKKMGGIGAALANFISVTITTSINLIYFLIKNKISIKEIFIQLSIFYLFTIIYILLIEKYELSFIIKFAFYALFACSTIYINQKIIIEILRSIKLKELIYKN